MFSKSEWRRQLRRARQQIPRETRQRAELATSRALKPLIKRGKKIAVYAPIGSEMRLDHFIRTAQKRGAHIYLPYITPKNLRLWFTPIDGKLERARGAGSLNIPQYSGKKIRAHRLNVMILPVVGVDKRAYRLGQGGGFYDATLAANYSVLQPRKVAVGFACQLVDELPSETHDCQVDDFACELGILSFKK